MREANEALIVVDVQNDFCPQGALAVPKGDEIIAPINQLMADFSQVILTQDWHPIGHSSFASSHEEGAVYSVIEMAYGPQVLWPDHCVQETPGAAFHDQLLRQEQLVLRKGQNPAIDSYSAFYENDRKTPTGLQDYLDQRGITQVTLVGLAYDFCVAYSALDAAKLGYKVVVRRDLCRAIDLNGSADEATAQMLAAGVVILDA